MGGGRKPATNPLSLWERVRVRADRTPNSPHPSPLPKGEGALHAPAGLCPPLIYLAISGGKKDVQLRLPLGEEIKKRQFMVRYGLDSRWSLPSA